MNPDHVTSDAVVQEMQRINPTVLQLAVSNVRAEQWKQFASDLQNDQSEDSEVKHPPQEG